MKNQKKQIGLFYWQGINFGDLLNKFLLQELFDVMPVYESFEKAEMFCVGSILDRLLTNGVISEKERQLQQSALKDPPVKIWGTGLMYPYDTSVSQLVRPISACAVRGELTRRQLSEILKEEIHCALGDPGLLASVAVPAGAKVWKVGIIPHYREIGNDAFLNMEKKLSDALFIDVRQDPEIVLKQISQCDRILSSSLHGVIVADSYGIPNCWCRLPGNTLGNTEYKYHDYFSAFGTDRSPFILENGAIPDLDKDCAVSFRSKRELRQKQKELLNSFPDFNK